MKAARYLESIGLSNVIDEEFFNDDDKSWYKVQELMESYHQAKLDLLTIPDVVGRSEQCCSNPKHKTDVNEMFENWVECKNCGKEII